MREGGSGREGGREGEAGGGRRRQGVHHKINPFTVSSGCKVRYEADMSNETVQSSKGRAIKAYIKLMELIISAAIKPFQRAALSFGDQPERLINNNNTPPSLLLRTPCCNRANICASLAVILWVGAGESCIKNNNSLSLGLPSARRLRPPIQKRNTEKLSKKQRGNDEKIKEI